MWDWLENGIARWTPSCQEVVRLASEALERRLTLRERLALRMHFAICYLCRRYARQTAVLHEGLRSHGELFAECPEERLTAGEKRTIKERCRAGE